MPEHDDPLIDAAKQHASAFDGGGLPAAPARHLAIVTCMDARIDPLAIFGLGLGDAHVIRNAGGVVTEDTVRSLMLSQHLLGTTDIALVHHTGCGLEGKTDEDVAETVSAKTGVRPSFEVETFREVDDSVRRSIERLQATPLVGDQQVRGFVYDIETGHLRPVSQRSTPS